MTDRKPWWKQPGEVRDTKGYPIYPGDLLRSLHFIGRNRKRYYLYHVAVFIDGYMELVPTSHLQPDKVKGCGRCRLSEDMGENMEILSGHGPEPFLDYEDRPRMRRTKGDAGS